jgi:hypothetical protein
VGSPPTVYKSLESGGSAMEGAEYVVSCEKSTGRATKKYGSAGIRSRSVSPGGSWVTRVTAMFIALVL